MAASFGYGKRLFVQGLAKLCCRLARYIVKHRAKLNSAMAADAGAISCLDTLVSCAVVLCNKLNISDR